MVDRWGNRMILGRSHRRVRASRLAGVLGTVFGIAAAIAVVGVLVTVPSGATPAASGPGAGRAGRVAEIRFASGSFRPDGPVSTPPGWYRDVSERESPRGRRYLVALASGPLDPDQRHRMEKAGAEVLGYLPDHGYRVRLNPAAVESIRKLSFVVWLGETPPHFKVQPELAARAGRAAGAPIPVRVVLESDEPPERARQALAGLDVLSAPSGKDRAWRLQATVPAGRLGAVLSRLAGLPEVESVEIVRPFRPMNQDAVWVHQSFVGPSAQQTPIFDRGIYGCGQVLGLADSGQDYDLCFFRDTVNGAPPFSSCLTAPCPAATPALNRRKDILYYNWSGTPTGDDDTCPATLGASGHGTHTSGSAAGDQSPYADCAGFTTPGRNGGDGQAPGAKLVIQEMGDGLEYLNNRGGTLWNLADVAYQSGVRIHSNSWGGACHDIFGQCIEGCTIPYDSFARDADLAMWTYPDLLLVTSAGNAGEFCPPPIAVGTPANAKSLITAGSVGHGTGADTVSTFSSPGPVHDGRLKPTLAAQGEFVVSAGSDANPASNNCATCSLDGTSMSSPTTAGLAVLVREYYTAGYYATGSRNPASGFTPTGALVKATLLDGAVDPGNAAPSPDFEAGYGRILLSSTLAFTGSPFQLHAEDHRAGVTTGSVVVHAYDVSGSEPFRATLVWSDYPASLNAAVARVNELKLEVIDPNGDVWFQTLDGGTGAPVRTSSPAAPHDARNVEERLVFENPAPGRWVVRVLGVSVPMGPQPFALLVRGNLTDCPAPGSPGAPTLTTPADHQVQVSWNAVGGAAAYNVYRSLGTCPGGPWVRVASAVTGTSHLDGPVSGGATYSYTVAAASDTGAFCESAPSPCAEVVPTGDCFLTPDFGGVQTAASAGSTTCGIILTWNPASSPCTEDVRYNVYRSTTPGFTPGPSNRIARCLGGASYHDTAGLTHGTTYYYTVRAEDATTGHGGPCRGGNEDSNAAGASAGPDGPPGIGTLSDDAGDTDAAAFIPIAPWGIAPTGGNQGPKVYRGDCAGFVCADLMSPILTLNTPASGPQLSFATIHTLEFEPFGIFGASEGSVGQVEIATGPGFSNWTRLPLTPNYPQPVDLTFTTCDTITDGTSYFSGVDTVYSVYTANLTNWAGGDVRIRFRLSGDAFYPSGAWWIDDLQITQTLVPGSCTTQPLGPPPIPDGASVPGAPLTVSRSGGDVVLNWDATQCPPAAVNVYWGNLGDFSAFAGGFCGLAPTGTATLSLGDDVWFLVVGTDGASIDGSWSRDQQGNELIYGGATAACPAITQHVANNGCP
jgi:hypothetical protein